MNEEAIRTVDLVKVYEQGRVRALDGVTLWIGRGEFVAVTGPSGSGKTTLLNMLGALDYPTSGQIFLNSREIMPSSDLDRVRATEVGFVFQLHNLIPTLTCLENVEVPMMAAGVRAADRRARGRELLKAVGLSERADFRPTRVSGGERQRVAVARALANRAPILLADEPTGNLDSKTGEEVLRLMLDLRARHGLTLVVVTHNPEIARRADRGIELRDGKLVAK